MTYVNDVSECLFWMYTISDRISPEVVEVVQWTFELSEWGLY